VDDGHRRWLRRCPDRPEAVPDRHPGGLDSIAGTIVAAIAIGVLECLGGGYVDESLGSGFGGIAPYLVLLAVLLLRPQGLFGRPPVRRV
jgi:branched-chain amino acid transport system permease protein